MSEVHEEPYELDGIRTAMTKTVESDRGLIFVTCPCGYEVAMPTDVPPVEWLAYRAARDNGYFAALRFHFTHCPQAKP